MSEFQPASRPRAQTTASRSLSRRPSWVAPFCPTVAYGLATALMALLGTSAWLWAQDAATTIAVNVKVVTLPVTVRDKHGKIVRDLTKDDFTLQEDGRAQTIKYFSQDSNLPLTLGLLVDTSRSQTNVLEAERNASRSFLDQMLVQSKDKAFVIHFDHEVELLQDLTSSHEKLQAALDLLKTPSDRERSNDPNDTSNSPSGSDSHHGGGTQLYDAVFLASNELMKKQSGPESAHHSHGRCRPWQQDLFGGRNRVGATRRYSDLLDLFRGCSSRRGATSGTRNGSGWRRLARRRRRGLAGWRRRISGRWRSRRRPTPGRGAAHRWQENSSAGF